MAQKKIIDFILRSSVTDSCNFIVDDSIQGWRVTALQIFNYLLPKFSSSVTITGAGTTLTSSNCIVLLNPSADFTQALPACASLATGFIMTFKNISASSAGKIATLDASTTELIDESLTLALAPMDSVRLFNTGTKWIVI